MYAKFLGVISLAAVIGILTVNPVGAQSFGNGRGNGHGNGQGNGQGNRGNHYGWRNNQDRFGGRMGGNFHGDSNGDNCRGNGQGNRGNHYGWRNNQDRFGGRMGSNFNGGNVNADYNNVGNNGYGAFGTNSIQARPYWGQQTNLTDKVAKIQQRLASGNLSPDKAARLQAELDRLQGRQTGLTSYWNNRLTSEQQYLQQLLSSGTLSPTQQARVQDRLNRITNAQSGIASGTGFNNPGALSGLRNILGF